MKKYTDYQLDQMFREFLDAVYDPVQICSYEYQASRALAEVDPVAYRVGFSDWLDSQISDGQLFEHADGSIHDEEEEAV